MKIYIYEDYNGDCGEQEIFTDKNKAIKYAEKSWECLTDREKGNMEWCHVIEVEATEEQFEQIKEYGYNEDTAPYTADVIDYVDMYRQPHPSRTRR